MNKKRAFIISGAVALLAALFPFENRLRDGGTAVYEPVTHLYRAELLHRVNPEGITCGTVIYIFGIQVYNDSTQTNGV